MNLIVGIGLLVLFIGSNAATFGVVSEMYKARARADIAEMKQAAAESAIAERVELASLRKAAAESKTVEVVKWRTVKNETERVVERPVYSQCVLDVDGMRNRDAILDLLQFGDRREPAAAVSVRSGEAQAGQHDGRAAQSPAVGLRAVPRLR